MALPIRPKGVNKPFVASEGDSQSLSLPDIGELPPLYTNAENSQAAPETPAVEEAPTLEELALPELSFDAPAREPEDIEADSSRDGAVDSGEDESYENISWDDFEGFNDDSQVPEAPQPIEESSESSEELETQPDAEDEDIDFDAIFNEIDDEINTDQPSDSERFPDTSKAPHAEAEESVAKPEEFSEDSWGSFGDEAVAELDEEENELSEEDDEEEAQEDLSETPAKKERKARKPKKTSKRKNDSRLTKLANGLIGFLTRIPFIGRIFKPLERFARFVIPALILLLILGIPLGVYSFAGKVIADPPILAFPDGGSAIIHSFKFDKDSKTASAEVTNTGDVIAEATPIFTVWVYELGLDPSKWTAFQELGTCEGESISVDIDETITVQAVCNFETIPGITATASGYLAY